ncbi:MAG TPA: HlyD family efflux transporter periplasmic adaptor subunit [Candidatus Elarobacter sp.]|jgi:multidrug efflux pump subunit AcrA (membrane-fusion protein)|nr:HlyD family efflux transporter periplasmic adaptor subunit [Candidatus Elarobacter sp.]
MDVVRARGHRIPALPFALAGLLGVCALGAYGAISLVHPREIVPTVERASVVTDVVRRGTLVRSVAAPGQFVPARIAVVAAPSDGVVSSVLVRPGTHVVAGTPIAELRNPDLDADRADLDAQIAAATAQARAIAEEARSATLEHQSALRGAVADREESSTQLEVNRTLHDQGLIGDLAYRVARIKASSAGDHERIAAAAVGAAVADGVAKLAAQRAVIAGLVARRNAKSAQLAGLTVVAGETGVVQSVAALVGARANAGTELARIAGDQDLEAVLQVAETDARLVSPGLRVRLDTGAQHLDGVVSRLEPAAQNGGIPVHVALAQPSLAARPQMHVEGAIELGRVANAISIARPAGAADGVSIPLYRLDPDGRGAERVRVELGSGPADRVQVRAGLVPGDVVIVSDTSTIAGDAPHIALR